MKRGSIVLFLIGILFISSCTAKLNALPPQQESNTYLKQINKDIVIEKEMKYFSLSNIKEEINFDRKSFLYDEIKKLEYRNIGEVMLKEFNFPAQETYLLGLSISGSVDIFNPKGFARVIAIDEYNREWLIFGSDFLFIENFASFENICEETCLFDQKIKINKLRIELFDANIIINQIFYKEDINRDEKHTSKELKNIQHNIKLNLVQDYVEKNRYSWNVGDTTVSKNLYRDLKSLQYDTEILKIPYDFFFYKGGIYSLKK
tara:strand:- start:3292 stop:4074 length:783 start_codon:yes stop_codon:yes gene_type:complete